MATVVFLQAIQTRLLTYTSPAAREREIYFSCARNLANAQFQLADAELTQRLWQDVSDRDLDVDRVLNLMYGCWDQHDAEAMTDADEAYLQRGQADDSSVDTSSPGIFEHC